MYNDWFDMSRRLRRFLMTHSDIIFGYRWIAQCGNWTVLIIRNKDVYHF